MSTEQKQAWFVLGLMAIACIGFVTLGLIFGFRWASGAFGILFLGGLTPLIGRGKKPDERDVSIGKNATLAGGIASYLAFVLGCMCIWFVEFLWHGHDQVSVHLLAMITGLGGMTLYVVRSLVVLILYGRHVEADNA